MFRYINFILFFIASSLYFIFFYYYPNNKITQEVLDLFPQNEDRQIIDIYNKFADSKYIFVAIKGFESGSRRELDAFLARVKNIENVQDILIKKQASKEMRDFIAQNYFYIANINTKMLESSKNDNIESIRKLDSKEMENIILNNLDNLNKSIQKAMNNETLDSKNNTESAPQNNLDNIDFEEIIANSGFNPLDPLGIFSLPKGDSNFLIAKDYGYAALVEMKSVNQKDVENTLESFKEIAKDFPQIRYFSQNFMGVENLNLILKEVSFLLTFASIVFVALYFIIIRIPLLTINTICTLIVANIVAIFAVSYIYPKVTIMALSFGMGVSNIAIDYMMHHNFFGLYALKKPTFNKPVFYGYITTIVGFGACLFIPFPLLTQLALYAIISLSFCYISFAFIYPRIGFSAPRLFLKMANLRLPVINSWYFFIAACAMFIFSFLHLRLDFDLSKLDYQNKPMLKERDFFYNAFSTGDSQILLSSDNLDSLILLTKDLQNAINNEIESKLNFEDSISSKNPNFSQNHIESNLQDSKDIDSKNIESKIIESNIILPLALMPTNAQMSENKALLDSKNMLENKATLLKLLPTLKQKLLQETGENENAKDFIENLIDIFAESYEIGEAPVITQKIIYNLGIDIVIDSKLKSQKNTQNDNIESSEAIESASFYYIANIPTKYLYIAQNFQNLLEDSKQNLALNTDSKDSKNLQNTQLNSDKSSTKEQNEATDSITKSLKSYDISNLIESNSYIQTKSLQDFMDNITDSIYKPMLIILTIALTLMICMVFITCKGSFLSSVVFILFPLSAALCVVSAHSEVNIMHLFALLILVVVSVDYGIYSITEGDNPRTSHAIFFSTITTGVSFGIFIISKTKALNSFGEVIFTGMICVLFMLVFHKIKPRLNAKTER